MGCKRSALLLFCSLLVIFLCLAPVEATAISSPPKKTLVINFEPNLKIDGDCSKGLSMGCFKVGKGSSDALIPYAKGDLAEYVTLERETITFSNGGWENLEFDINLPANISPGTHVLRIGAVEGSTEASEGSGVGAKVGAERHIKIIAPYPDQYIKAELNTKTASGHVDFVLTLNNLGHEDLSDISSKLAIFGSGGGKAKEKDFPSVSKLATEAKKNVTLSIPEDEFSPDKYSAKAFISYGDGKESVADSNFTIEEKVFGVAESEFDQDYMPLIWVITGTAILMSLFLGLQYWKRKKKGRK